MQKRLILLLFLVLSLAACSLLKPSEIKAAAELFNEFGGGSESEPPEVISSDPPALQPPKIVELTPQKSIYHVGDNVTARLKLLNELDVPYNLSVHWILNGTTERFSWSNFSDVKYNASWSKEFSIWYHPQEIGNWEIQAVIQSEINGALQTYEQIALFRVISVT